jgi:hypothetical protein
MSTPPPKELAPPWLPEIVLPWIVTWPASLTVLISTPAPLVAWLPETVVFKTWTWADLFE